MSESTQLVATLKRQLKQQGMTYRDVASALGLSEPSIKRMFASEIFTLDRLVQICNLLGFTLAELTREAETGQRRLSTLTEIQESEIVTDPALLIVAVCALNHWTLDEMLQHFSFTEAECIRLLLKLDALRILDLMPGNRIRLNVTRDFHWLPYGPIRNFFNNTGQQDFLHSDFNIENETLTFVHGMLTEQAMAQALEELNRLRQKFAELHEASLASPMNKRYGVGMLMAFRKWEPEVFRKYKRSP